MAVRKLHVWRPFSWLGLRRDAEPLAPLARASPTQRSGQLVSRAERLVSFGHSRTAFATAVVYGSRSDRFRLLVAPSGRPPSASADIDVVDFDDNPRASRYRAPIQFRNHRVVGYASVRPPAVRLDGPAEEGEFTRDRLADPGTIEESTVTALSLPLRGLIWPWPSPTFSVRTRGVPYKL